MKYINDYMEKVSALAEIQPVLKNAVTEKKNSACAEKFSGEKIMPVEGMEFQFGLKTD